MTLVEQSHQDGYNVLERTTRSMIIRTLTAFPTLTKSMLAAHVRPYDPEGWRDTLEQMVQEGIILKKDAAPLGRVVSVYSLNQNRGKLGEDGK